MNDKLVRYLVFGVALALLTGLGGFVWNANTRIALMEHKIAESEKHAKINSKFWKLHSWARQEINKARVRDGLQMVNWPELEDAEEEHE